MADGSKAKKGRARDEGRRFGRPSHAALIKAINHPVRRQVLRIFEDGVPRSAKDVSRVIPVALGTVSYHFAVLKETGVVTPGHEEKRRGALKKICVFNPEDLDPYVGAILQATKGEDEDEVPRSDSCSSSDSTAGE